jgi:hypothetical protein
MKSNYEYLLADKYVILNDNDPDLRPIVLSLPSPPQLHLIDGYGLPPEEQRFSRLVVPRGLIDLEAEAVMKTKDELSSNKNNVITLLKIQKTFWDLLQARNKSMKKEIDFIRKVWWHRLNGYWFFNCGKPTYITGRHFYFLNMFTMDTKDRRPSYRDCDRREYIFKEYCWTASETFADIDKQGFAIPDDNGRYKMVDVGRRICFGDAQTKNRRRGNTSKAISDLIEITTRTIGTDGGGIQSYTEDSAKAHFKGKLFPAWNGLPVWLKPYSPSGRGSDTLKFDVAKNDYGEHGLGTQIEYATTSSEKFFDGKKMIYLLTDEEGKTSQCSVSKRWGVNKHTLAQGDGMLIHGYSSHPSTVDQLSDGSGDYQYLMSESNFYKRIKNKGQTPSGLFRVFIPAQDGLEGYIDSYGYSVTGVIKEHQKKEGFKMTAEEYLRGERELLLSENTPESMRKYREHKQLFPMQYSDSWTGIAGDVGFDIEKIDSRLAELRRSSVVRRGNLEWVNGVWGTEVYFVDDNEKGKFIVSMFPREDTSNKKVKISFFNAFTQATEDAWRPTYPGVFTAGADPFNTGGKTDRKISDALGKKSRLSDGGLTVLWNYDDSVDAGKNKYDWESYKFALTYRNRSSNTDYFNEDVLKACIWYGALLYPETNTMNTYEYFVKKGFGGYLIYDTDKYTGRLKDKPGMDSLERSKQDVFALWRDYIDYRCHKEEHEFLLRELKDIQGIEFMRHFDLIAAGGMALMGAKSIYADVIKRMDKDDYDLEDFL